MDKRDLVNAFDHETEARKKLPKTAYDYYRSGANDEITLHDNHAAYERIQLNRRRNAGDHRPGLVSALCLKKSGSDAFSG